MHLAQSKKMPPGFHSSHGIPRFSPICREKERWKESPHIPSRLTLVQVQDICGGKKKKPSALKSKSATLAFKPECLKAETSARLHVVIPTPCVNDWKLGLLFHTRIDQPYTVETLSPLRRSHKLYPFSLFLDKATGKTTVPSLLFFIRCPDLFFSFAVYAREFLLHYFLFISWLLFLFFDVWQENHLTGLHAECRSRFLLSFSGWDGRFVGFEIHTYAQEGWLLWAGEWRA